MKLRAYQETMVAGVADAFRAGRRSVLLQLGTGGGKTATASDILRRTVARGHRAIFMAHLDTLVEDTHARLVSAGVHAGFIQAGRPVDVDAPVNVCSMQTLHARDARPPADLIIVDEAHRALGASIRGILADYPEAWILGLTATPQRGDGQPLGDVFETMVSGPSNSELTAQGHLVPCDVLSPDSDGSTFPCVEAYQRWTPGTRAIVFAETVADAHALVCEFVASGVTAAVMLGDTSREERRRVRAGLRGGSISVLVGVGIFVEGFDEPSIETVILARPFGTTGSFLQAIGRGLRPSPGKTRCTVLDLHGSCMLHGLPDEDRVWSLTGTAVARAETMPSIQRCRECFAIFRPAAVCPRCGHRAEAGSVERIPRKLSRAETLLRVSDLDVVERDRRYFSKLVWVASTRMRMTERRAEAWARGEFFKKFQRQVGEVRT